VRTVQPAKGEKMPTISDISGEALAFVQWAIPSPAKTEEDYQLVQDVVRGAHLTFRAR